MATERTKEEKKAFLETASPWKIVEEYPREYTLQMRWIASMWHTTAEKRTPLEMQMYDIACGVLAFEEQIKAMEESYR